MSDASSSFVPPGWWQGHWMPPACFFLALLAFHLSEALLAFSFNRDLFSSRSFLISKPYLTAMAAGLAEYALERLALPGGLKTDSAAAFISFSAGAALVLAGGALRLAAVLTAGRAFTHDLQPAGRPPRVPRVVTRGVYAWCRHPGYLGWLMWAPGTMLLLANPLSAAAFFWLASRFFQGRVPYEERLLLEIYGDEYAEYARRAPTRMWGIP